MNISIRTFLKKKVVKKIFSFSSHVLYGEKNSYFTWHARPMYSEECTHFEVDNCEDIGILLQGPIQTEHDFTLETIKLYKKYYPNACIVVSTWDNTNQELVKKIQELKVILVLSAAPEHLTGAGTINLQRISTVNGLKKIKEAGCKYVCKTRTDQRMYASGILSSLKKLLFLFPIDKDIQAEARIITVSLSTFSNRYYNTSDMWNFGTLKDMQRYWDCPEDLRDGKSLLASIDHKGLSQFEYSKHRTGEVYFTSHYIESLGFDLKWTLEDSLSHLKNLFIIIDKEYLDLFWVKYTDKEYRWRDYRYPQLEEFGFKDWVNLQG